MSQQNTNILPTGRRQNRIIHLRAFAWNLIAIGNQIGFKLSPRGWCYQLEGLGYISKGEFDRVQRLINECRENGFLPLDFVAEEEARAFTCVNIPTRSPPNIFLAKQLERLNFLERWYEPDYWDNESHYIQMLVEKIDLVTLFQDVCCRYHVPIATSKGWSSVTQRAEIISRFKIAEDRGQIPVLLYCGDLDPWGVAISDLLSEHLDKLSRTTGWTTRNLIIDRFGLNIELVEEYNLSWIDNLETGSGKKADRSNPIVQRYIEQFGERKVEANAIVVIPEEARSLCVSAIEKYAGSEVLDRFTEKELQLEISFQKLRDHIDFELYSKAAIESLEKISGDV